MHPIIRLANGLCVANFSSPHPFKFVTGEELPACDAETSRRLLLEAVEETSSSPCGRWSDIDLTFRMSAAVEQALVDLADREEIDVVLVPLPVLTAIKTVNTAVNDGAQKAWDRVVQKARVIRVADRVSKTIYGDRFCR